MSRTIIVTGAGSGIGAATAALLQQRGDTVVGVDLRGEEREAVVGRVLLRDEERPGGLLLDVAPGDRGAGALAGVGRVLARHGEPHQHQHLVARLRRVDRLPLGGAAELGVGQRPGGVGVARVDVVGLGEVGQPLGHHGRELVVDAWRMVVPKKLSVAYDVSHPVGPG